MGPGFAAQSLQSGHFKVPRTAAACPAIPSWLSTLPGTCGPTVPSTHAWSPAVPLHPRPLVVTKAVTTQGGPERRGNPRRAAPHPSVGLALCPPWMTWPGGRHLGVLGPANGPPAARGGKRSRGGSLAHPPSGPLSAQPGSPPGLRPPPAGSTCARQAFPLAERDGASLSPGSETGQAVGHRPSWEVAEGWAG